MNAFQEAADRLKAQRLERERKAAIAEFEAECSRRAGEIAQNLINDSATFRTTEGETKFIRPEPNKTPGHLADQILNH